MTDTAFADRRLLIKVAYRMRDSLADAEDPAGTVIRGYALPEADRAALTTLPAWCVRVATPSVSPS